nr:ammonium transporter [Citrobacter freundii]
MGILPVQFQILDPANTAFMLLCTSLVMLMTPGLAFFYGGLVQRKGILTIMFQSFVSMSWVAILWFAVGYSLAFGPSLNGIIGNPLHYAFLQNINANTLFTGNEAGIPILVHFVYQMMFAIITPALITGAFVGRVKFKAYLIFITL